MKTIKFAIPMLLALAYGSSSAAVTPVLGAANDFGVLAASTVTNSGPTNIRGELGVNAGSAITGLDQITLSGAVHMGDTLSLQARTDAGLASVALANQLTLLDLSTQDLGGMSLTSGAYRFTSAADLNGTLTLDAKNDPNARFVFQIGTALLTGSNAKVNVINGTAGTGVFWQVGSAATLGTGTNFAGNIIAGTNIALGTNATICGRAIALTAGVTMLSNTISNDCGNFANGTAMTTDYGSNGFSGASVSAVPEVSMLTMMGTGLFALVGWQSRRRIAVTLNKKFA